jgi:uncharacterized membrane protein
MYNIIVTLHILLAGIWLSNILLSLVVKINSQSSGTERINLILFYLKYSNLLGMIGALGILVTGIYMTFSNPAYSFFQFSANHWLLSKQIVMVIILAIVFILLIPNAKLIKKQVVEGNESLDTAVLSKLNKITWTINTLVILNILFALSRRLM